MVQYSAAWWSPNMGRTRAIARLRVYSIAIFFDVALTPLITFSAQYNEYGHSPLNGKFELLSKTWTRSENKYIFNIRYEVFIRLPQLACYRVSPKTVYTLMNKKILFK